MAKRQILPNCLDKVIELVMLNFLAIIKKITQGKKWLSARKANKIKHTNLSRNCYIWNDVKKFNFIKKFRSKEIKTAVTDAPPF